jgi:hypothetical protein
MDSIPWDGSRKRKSKDGYSFGSGLELECHEKGKGWVPDGVIIVTAGGLKGYSGGNLRVPATKVNNMDKVEVGGQTHVLSAYKLVLSTGWGVREAGVRLGVTVIGGVGRALYEIVP